MATFRLHPIQEKVLKLAAKKNLSGLSLREIGELVGDKAPQKIKHHLQQLEKKGLIKIDRTRGIITKPKAGSVSGFLEKGKKLLEIPILGVANCGPAELLAEENFVGVLRISTSLLHRQSNQGLFAVRADGPSMNRSRINGKSVDNGDYLIVDGEDRSPKDGDVVLSVINGAANVKRFRKDNANKQIALLSDSDQDFAPIYIHPQDSFFVNGKIIEVIKLPKQF